MSRIHIVVDGHEYDVDDLTLDEIVRFERSTGAAWTDMNPTVSALHCRAVLVEFYGRTRGREDAEKAVGALTAREAVDHIRIVGVDDDRPTEYRDGVPVVDPKAEQAATVTT